MGSANIRFTVMSVSLKSVFGSIKMDCSSTYHPLILCPLLPRRHMPWENWAIIANREKSNQTRQMFQAKFCISSLHIYSSGVSRGYVSDYKTVKVVYCNIIILKIVSQWIICIDKFYSNMWSSWKLKHPINSKRKNFIFTDIIFQHLTVATWVI